MVSRPRCTLTHRGSLRLAFVLLAIVSSPRTPALTAQSASGLPLEPTRTVRFQAAAGTWISLDVSPDGRTIAFELLGHLYAMPIAGGHARPLTAGLSINRQPRYSPDGRQLAFISDRSGSQNLWIADASGTHPHQLSHLCGYYVDGAVSSPTWSPDGNTIVVAQELGATRPGAAGLARSRRWLLAAYDAATGQMQWISDTTAEHARGALGPAFGATSDWVYAAVAGVRPDPYTDLDHWRLARVELRTGQIQPEMQSQIRREGMRPVLSRDGRWLVYATSSGSRTGLRLRDLDTDRERWLVREALDNPPTVAQLVSGDLAPAYAFTPDAKAIVVAYGGAIHRVDRVSGQATLIPFTADIERPLGPLQVHQFVLPDTALRTRNVLQPAISPDGHWVAFSALDRIWLLELPNAGLPAGKPFRLTADSIGEFYPSWAPDNRWIAYSTWRDGEGGAVRAAAVSFKGGAPKGSTRLTQDTALYFHTAVAPDGKRIAAVRAVLPRDGVLGSATESLDPALVSLPAGGGAARPIASLKAEEQGVRYPVDQLYFTSDTERLHVGLKSWRWDGTDQRTALAVTGLATGSGPGAESEEEAGGVLSPDGRRVLMTRRYALFEVTVPVPSSGKADTLDLQQALGSPLGAETGAARRWGTALAPWISWSRSGRRVLFNQGGTLFVGDVGGGWTTFVRLDIPLAVPVDVPRGVVLLHGARLITMRGHQVIERGDLLIRNNRIVAVGATGRVPVPRDAHVLDLSGKTLLPGYVDVHDHILLARGVHPQQCWQCLLRLAYGVTTSRDPQPLFAGDIFSYRERERAGDLLAPRIFSTGLAFFGADPLIRTLDDARDAVRPNAEYFGSETFKIYYDAATDRRAWQLLAMAAQQAGLNATAHTHSPELVLATVTDGLSGIEHVPDIPIYSDLTTLVARSGATITPTYGAALFGSWQNLFHRYGVPWQSVTIRRLAAPGARASMCSWCQYPQYGPLESANLARLTTSAERIGAGGGNVAVGSHGNIPGLGFHYELWLYALGGMLNHEILRSATIVGATSLGHAADLGSLEPGKLADLQVLDRNPLRDIHATASIRYVMKNGRLYDAETLTEVWPRHQTLASTYLWNERLSPPATGPDHSTRPRD